MRVHGLVLILVCGSTPVRATASDANARSRARELTRLGVLQMIAGSPTDTVVETFTRAVEADGSYAPARFHLAGVFSALQRWRDARDAFDGFLHTNRDPKLAAIAVSERDHAVREQRGEADAGSEDALQREMLEAEAGRALRENQLHAVVVAAGRALAIDRGAWKPYLFTAAALVRAGRPDLALPCLSAAVERAPASEGPPIRALIRNVNKLIDMNNALIALRRSVAENDPRGTAAALRAASKAMPTDVGLRLAAERTLESVSAAPPLEDNE